MTKPVVLIFAKSPRMGVSKTRLAAGIGPTRAWSTKRALDAYTCRVAQSAAWHTKLAVAPKRDLTARFANCWPDNLPRIDQGGGDLGARMARSLARHSKGPVCIIGSDLPDLQTRDLAKAFRALQRYDVVLGPATDGGYWLIGLKPRRARVVQLSGVRWSSVHTLSDTLACFPKSWRVAFLRELEDVDDAASFRRRR
jgi:uncharacterized protein